MTSTQNMSSVNNSANTQTNTAKTSGQNPSSKTSGVGGDYPEQIHAGAVGYGPNYHTGPTLGDKAQGLKDELKGKITRDPDLVQHGREVKTGEERRKKLTGEDERNPFSDSTENEGKAHASTDQTSKPSGAHTQQASNLKPETSTDHPPRHQSHPMQPTGGAETHHRDYETHASSGLNGPIGLREGKIQTMAGTPDLAPTTASQQPAFQKEQEGNTQSHPSSQKYDTYESRVGEGPDKRSYEPYKKETVGQGGDAIQEQGRSDKSSTDKGKEGHGPSVTFDDLAGRPATQSQEATRADATSMPPQY